MECFQVSDLKQIKYIYSSNYRDLISFASSAQSSVFERSSFNREYGPFDCSPVLSHYVLCATEDSMHTGLWFNGWSMQILRVKWGLHTPSVQSSHNLPAWVGWRERDKREENYLLKEGHMNSMTQLVQCFSLVCGFLGPVIVLTSSCLLYMGFRNIKSSIWE